MELWVVYMDTDTKGQTRETLPTFWEEKLFGPLTQIADQSDGALVIKNKLTFIGAAVVEATDEAVADLRQRGFICHANQTMHAI